MSVTADTERDLATPNATDQRQRLGAVPARGNGNRNERVDAVFVVHFGADNRGIEDAKHAHLLVDHHGVAFVAVQQVHAASRELMNFAGLPIEQAATTFHEPNGF